ncbi:MAG: ABC transporter ATP-binding protein [Gammaproteobacteria bacterium]
MSRKARKKAPPQKTEDPGSATASADAAATPVGEPIFQLRRVQKHREAEGVQFRLNVSSLRIHAGEMIALVGESGCGKSTLLDMLAMVLQPDESGTFLFRPAGEEVDVARVWAKHDQNRLGDLRKYHVGYVLQTGGLLPFLSVRDNISLSRNLLDLPEDDTVANLAAELGIRDQLGKLPGLLSAGQRQRVAIARALAHKPSIVMADEPTASLDPVTAHRVMDHFVGLVREMGITLIVASHDWSHVDKLGLRKLTHRAREIPGARGSESVFSD